MATVGEAQKRKAAVATVVLLLACYALVQAGISSGFISEYYQTNIFLVGINIILAASLNLINGFTGHLSLGHAGFMAVGAYACVVCTLKLGLPFPLGVLAAILGAALVGFLIGLPTLRLRGDYLAIATLGFGEIIRVVLVNTEYLGGATGILGIPRTVTWTWLFWSTVLVLVLIRNFVRSAHGRACLAVRESELAAEMMGVNTTYYKVLAFVLGAAGAGLAGALYAHYFYVIQPSKFSFLLSFDILVMVMVGGLGSITGACLGAVLLTLLSALLQNVPEFRMILYAVLLVVSAIYRPQGILGEKELSWELLARWGGILCGASRSNKTHQELRRPRRPA